ncbi:flavodoxin domain-containing protein [Halobacillus salinus]|nr:flavodoxin domain-containing protein [Halobacillus salinus]
MKTLIVYATKHGSTEKAVGMLEGDLSGDVRVMNVDDAWGVDLEPFDHVILGGPIYMGELHEKLSAYAARYQDTLLQKRVGLFICAGMEDPFILQAELENAYPEDLYEHAAVKEVFGYVLDFRQLKAQERKDLRINGVTESEFKLSAPVITEFALAMERGFVRKE